MVRLCSPVERAKRRFHFVQSFTFLSRTLVATTLTIGSLISFAASSGPAEAAGGAASATTRRDDVPMRGIVGRTLDPAPAGADALRVSVLGDGSGALLQVRLLGGAEDGVLTGYFAAPGIPVSFKGWKTLILPLSQFAFHSDNNPGVDQDGIGPTLASPTGVQFAVSAASARVYLDDLAWTTAAAAPTDAPLAVIDDFESVGTRSKWKAVGDFDQIRAVEIGANRNAGFVKSGSGSLSITVRSSGQNETDLNEPVLQSRLRATPKQAYVIYSRAPFETISPDSSPSVREVSPAPVVSLFATPGQTEPGTFAVYAGATLKNATVTMPSGLVSRTKAKIPATAVSLYVIRPALTVDGPQLLMKDDREALTGPLPTVRLTGSPITDIPAGSSKQFWLNVAVPPNQAPGMYTGKVLFQAAGQKPLGVTLNVEVLPMALRTAHYQYGVDLPSVLSADGAGPGEQAVTPEMMAAEFADMRRHGIKMVALHDRPANLQNALQLYKASGMSAVGPVVVTAPLGSAADFTTVAGLRSAVGLSDAFDLYYKLPADHAKSTDAVRDYGQQARTADKNALVVADVPSESAYADMSSAIGDELAPLYTLSSDHATKLMAAGHRSTPNRDWWTWSIGANDAIRNRLYAGFLLFKTGNGLYGAFPGPYQSFAAGTDPYAVFNRSGEGPDLTMAAPQMATYPVQGGVLDTVQWEAVRSGIDDIRYIDALKTVSRDLIDAHVGKSATDYANSFLLGVAGRPLLALNPTQVQALRRNIAGQTVKLQQMLSKAPH